MISVNDAYIEHIESQNESLARQNAVMRSLFDQYTNLLENSKVLTSGDAIRMKKLVEEYDCGNKWYKYIKDLEETNNNLHQMIQQARPKPQELIPSAIRTKLGLQDL